MNGSDNQPCSIDFYPFKNVEDPSVAYLVLETGIISAADLSRANVDQAAQSELGNSGTSDQVITFLDKKTNANHSLLLNPNAAYQKTVGDQTNFGYDYFASTYSMQTDCSIVDTGCRLTLNSSSYNCSSIFSGNISQEPSNGVIRIPDWNSSFYIMEANAPREITQSDDPNPFYFNVTAQVNSISDYLDNNGSSALPPQLVQTENGNVAFALYVPSPPLTQYDD